MKDFISVIIPCYNVQDYIEKCVESIENQTYHNIEILLIDDCSRDKTWKIINQLAKKYDNITCLQNERNSGAGYSRNHALKHAKYNLISFIDSDDYLEENYYEELLKTMKKEKADVVVCDIFVKYENVDGTNTRGIACSDPKDKYTYIDNGLAASPCNKLFKKEELLKYPFPEGIMNEDIATVLPIIIKAKKVTYTPNTYYNYIQRKSSVQNSGLNEKRFDLFKALDICFERIERKKENEEYINAIIHNQITLFFFYVIPKEKDKKKRKQFLRKFKELSEKYELRKNHLYWNFLMLQGTKHRLFYKTLLGLNERKLYWLSNSLISFYDWYSAKVKKPVIKENISLEDVISLAKIQHKLKERDFTISVAVPNYNYEKFLLQRIYSILNQKVKIDELIILDDCSTDDSRKLIDKIVEAIKPYINVRKIYNKQNSGTAFKQWRKGFEEATGDYVWIAEADDYCNSKFLENIIKPIKKEKNIVLSYTDTAFIDKDGYIIMKTIKPEIDILKSGHWDTDFVKDGVQEIKDFSYLNCTIANVSSVLFKRADYTKFFEEAGEFKQAGDWLFYLDIMSVGKIAFCSKALNYYRVHGNNVTALTKKQKHFDEIKKIHAIIEQRYELNKEQKNNIEERYNFLRKVWNLGDDKKD